MTRYRNAKARRREATKRYVIDSYCACALAYPDAASASVSRKVQR